MLAAQDPGGGGPLGCYQAVFDYVCGTADCDPITCPDSTSGPMCVRGRVNMLKCVPAVGQGKTQCYGTGTRVWVFVKWFGCSSGTYAAESDWIAYEYCEGAYLTGTTCQ